MCAVACSRELRNSKDIDVYRRSLQRAYVENLDNKLNPPPPDGAQQAVVVAAVVVAVRAARRSSIRSFRTCRPPCAMS